MMECNIGGEGARLKSLQRYEILDTAPEEAFDRITRLVKTVLQMPMAAVSLVDKDRQWFKSNEGLEANETPRNVSFCAQTIQDTRPLIVPDALADPRFANSPLVQSSPHIRFYAGVPLRTRDGDNVGALCAMDTKVRRLSSEQVALLQDLGQIVIDELELRLLGATDSLTGAMSRRQFLDNAREDVERAKRYRKPLSCLVIDLDYFKMFNDSYGHRVGDLALHRLVTVCKSVLRGCDYIGRIGGDEFAVMLPETPLLNALGAAQRLLSALAATTTNVSGHALNITASIGVAEYANPSWPVDRLLEAADVAMYGAKNSGRNRAVCYLDDDLQVITSSAMRH